MDGYMVKWTDTYYFYTLKDNGYYHEDIFGVTLKTAEVTNRVRAAAKK